MTHDPLCPNRKVMADFPSEIECGSCTFIAKVRDDERSRIADAVFDNRCAILFPGKSCTFVRG